MAEIHVNPGSIRSTATEVEDINSRLVNLASRMRGLAATPTRQCFPSIPQGQKLATQWEEAQATFGDGLHVVIRALAQLSSGMRTTAAGYESADNAIQQRLTTPLPDLPL